MNQKKINLLGKAIVVLVNIIVIILIVGIFIVSEYKGTHDFYYSYAHDFPDAKQQEAFWKSFDPNIAVQAGALNYESFDGSDIDEPSYRKFELKHGHTSVRYSDNNGYGLISIYFDVNGESKSLEDYDYDGDGFEYDLENLSPEERAVAKDALKALKDFQMRYFEIGNG